MKPLSTDTVLLVVANPVDLLTSLAQSLSGLPASQVLGTGTFLDTVRLRGLLADKAKVCIHNHRTITHAWLTRQQVTADSIDLCVLGVHGDSQVVAWSATTINGVPYNESFLRNTFNYTGLENEFRRRTQRAMQIKGATPFGIGSIISRICSSILFNERKIFPVTNFQPEFGCCFSTPVVLGREGITEKITMTLNSEEEADLAASAKRLRDTIERINDQ